MQVDGGSNHYVFTDHLHNYIHLLHIQNSNDIAINLCWSSLVKNQQDATWHTITKTNLYVNNPNLYLMQPIQICQIEPDMHTHKVCVCPCQALYIVGNIIRDMFKYSLECNCNCYCLFCILFQISWLGG